MQPQIGFIGFGEAAFHIAKGLAGAGLKHIHAYDKFAYAGLQAALIQKRAKEAGVTLEPGIKELVETSTIVISAVSANLSLPLAEESARYLKPGQLYVDLNSAGPDTKVAIDAVVSPKAHFIDAAVMGPVTPSGHKVEMLVSGGGAPALVEAMAPYGMNLTLLRGPVGTSSASKMFRSIFMKGFIALLLETVVAGHQYGIEDDILSSIEKSLTAAPLKEVINDILARGVIHSERRGHEMDEVIATLKNLNVDSTMSLATKKKFQWCTDQKFREHFKGVPPKDFHEMFSVLLPPERPAAG